MPLVFNENVLRSSILAVWKIDESEDFFFSNREQKWDLEELAKLKGGRRLEWIASRYLIQKMTSKSFGIKKDRFGKPQLDPKEYHISISHSHSYVAAIVSKHDVGIDIQKKVKKISKIAHKFVNEQEATFVNNRYRLSNLHIVWGAKESLFKAYGRKEVDYKKDLHVLPFVYRKKGSFKATINKKGYHFGFQFENKFFNNFYLVYGEKLD